MREAERPTLMRNIIKGLKVHTILMTLYKLLVSLKYLHANPRESNNDTEMHILQISTKGSIHSSMKVHHPTSFNGIFSVLFCPLPMRLHASADSETLNVFSDHIAHGFMYLSSINTSRFKHLHYLEVLNFS